MINNKYIYIYFQKYILYFTNIKAFQNTLIIYFRITVTVKTLVDEDISEAAVLSLFHVLSRGQYPILTFTLMAVSVFTSKSKIVFPN